MATIMPAPSNSPQPQASQQHQSMSSGDLPDRRPKKARSLCSTHIKVIKFSYMWTMSNFSFYQDVFCASLKSSTFSSGSNDKSNWLIRINPKGLDEESKDYVTLHLVLSSCEEKEGVMAKFKFSILNAKREEVRIMESQRAYRFMAGKDWGFKKFVKRDLLLDETSGLLPDDKLTIYCEIKVFRGAKEYSGQVSPFQSLVPTRRLPDDLEDLFKSQDFSDVTVCANGREFKAHKAVLAARSPMFKGMFSHDMKETKYNRVEVSDIDPDVLQEMLRYIYTGKSSLEPKFQNKEQKDQKEQEREQHLAIELLQAANKYQLDRLKLICEEALYSTLSADSVTEILSLADLYDANQLKHQAIEFINIHIAEVTETDGWTRMLRENPHLVAEVHVAQAHRIPGFGPIKKIKKLCI